MYNKYTVTINELYKFYDYEMKAHVDSPSIRLLIKVIYFFTETKYFYFVVLVQNDAICCNE